jgi:hypothetical protein
MCGLLLLLLLIWIGHVVCRIKRSRCNVTFKDATFIMKGNVLDHSSSFRDSLAGSAADTLRFGTSASS